MMEHKVKVESSLIPGAWRWECACGAKGNYHEDSKTASTFGSEHLEIVRPFVRDDETIVR